MTDKGTIPVLAAPLLDPGAGRVDLEVPAGLTIAEIVSAALPGLPESARRRVRVTLVTDRGIQAADPAIWHLARPRPGVRVVLRMIPGEGAVKSILQIVVAVAAVALSGAFAAPLAGALGISQQLASGLITLGVTALGNLAIASMFPPPEPPDPDKPRRRYAVGGFRNELRPDGAIPEMFGTLRYTPPLASSTWSEIVNGQQVIHAAFLFGGGDVDIEDIWLGETPIDDYDEVETELLRNVPASDMLTLSPQQVFEAGVGAKIEREWPTDDYGERISGPSLERPVVRRTGKDAAAASVILQFPRGLAAFSKKGDEKPHRVTIRIRQRQSAPDDWTEVDTIDIFGETTESFFRQFTWDLPSRGRWQIEVTRIDDPNTKRHVEEITWAALQTIRPEAPIAWTGRVTKLGLRARATAQFNGQIDRLSALCHRIVPDFDHVTGSWTGRATSNPAAAFVMALQGEANPQPATDDEIEWREIEDWHDFCREKDLKFDHVFEDEGISLRDALTVIAAAGRATPRRAGGKWGVVIDRPRALVTDHINLRNAHDISTTRSYVRLPHAFRVPFLDATNDYRPDERLVRRPGYEGPIALTELLEMPGKTDAAEIAREATRRFHELQYRPEIHVATQDHGVGATTRGDLVMFSNAILTDLHWTGRVRAVQDNMVVLDEAVEMRAGDSYVIRFLATDAPDSDGLVAGVSVIRAVRTVPGETRSLALIGTGDAPAPGSLVHFGLAAEDSYPVLIQAIEAGEEFSSILRMVAHAPIIDELTDAYVAPPWTGRVGDPVEYAAATPAPPTFTKIRAGLYTYEELPGWQPSDSQRTVTVFLSAADAGNVSLTKFRVWHRPAAGSWVSQDVPYGSGGVDIDGYVVDQVVEIYAQAIAFGGVVSAPTPTVTITVGAADPALPAGIDTGSVRVTGGYGVARLTVSVGDPATESVQVFRTPGGDALDTGTDALGDPVAVPAGGTIALSDGDPTRTELLSAGDMSDAGAWTAGGGWAISGGQADHAPGSAGTLSQALSLTVGATYRGGVIVTGRTAGSITVQLAGGTAVPAAAFAADGYTQFSLAAATGNDRLEIVATADFDGAVTWAGLFVETAACAPQGVQDYRFAAINAEGVASAVSGALSTNII